MAKNRQIEVFSASCPICESVISTVRTLSCPSCDITVLNMQDDAAATRAQVLGVLSVPAVAIDGVLVDCCVGRGVDEKALQAAGLGQPIA